MTGTKKFLLAMVLGSIPASGCMYVGVTPSVAGRAYVIKKQGSYLAGKSSLWNCDATTGAPTCYEVKNVAHGPVTVPAGGAASSSTSSTSTSSTSTSSTGANTHE